MSAVYCLHSEYKDKINPQCVHLLYSYITFDNGLDFGIF